MVYSGRMRPDLSVSTDFSTTGDYDREGWKPSWRTAVSVETMAAYPDRDDLAFDPHPLILGPVETETGDALRVSAMFVLATRADTLTERSRRQRLTGLETRELLEAQAAIQTLQRMAPTGALLPPRPGDLFSGSLA